MILQNHRILAECQSMFSESISSPNDLQSLHSFLVLGGGSSGDSSAKLLTSLGKRVILADRFPEKANHSLYEKVLSDNEPQEVLPGIDCIIKSPGILPDHLVLQRALEKKIPIVSEIALGRIFYKGPLIGITGTDGKSTTTALTFHLLKSQFPNAKMGGNIGVPFTSFCLEKLDLVVLELSSYQLDDSPNLKLTASALLNLASDHLERHKTMEAYALAKWKIQNVSDPKHNCFANPQFFQYTPFEKPNYANLHFVGENQSYFVSQNPDLVHTPNFVYDASRFPLKGKHNLMNLCFAISIAEVMGVSQTQIQTQLETFQGLPHRFQTVFISNPNPQYANVRFINDSKSTNLHSMLSGISGFQKGDPIFLLLGGIPKTEPIEPLVKRWKELECPLFVFGKAKDIWGQRLNEVGLPVFYYDTVELLVSDLKNKMDEMETKKEQKEKHLTVLFSPAGASFDLYKNFEERGNHFVRLVNETFGLPNQ